jgi:polysaccharide deacetylase family protein (PEP-CTERM system associated)
LSNCYKHELLYNFDKDTFRKDTEKTKKSIEDIIGEEINAFRAPFFSIVEKNQWVLIILADLGFTYDSSIFPASRDYGGLPAYTEVQPAVLELPNGKTLKEFPINTHAFLGKIHFVFSGGGYFRILPYWVIKNWSKKAPYLMTYFHPRDFDPDQPVLKNIPLHRKFKSYVGLKTAFKKFQNFSDDFDFVDLYQADAQIDWLKAKRIIIG